MGKREVLRIFLDSNVILSGLFSDKAAPRIILDILCLRLPFLDGMTGQYNIVEIERNLRKKMPTVVPIYEEYLPKLNLEIIPIPPVEQIRRSKWDLSPKDIPVLVSAINGRAALLITGDKKDFFKLKASVHCPLKIVSPSEFVDAILPEILKDYEGG